MSLYSSNISRKATDRINGSGFYNTSLLVHAKLFFFSFLKESWPLPWGRLDGVSAETGARDPHALEIFV